MRGIKGYGPLVTVGDTEIRRVAKCRQTMTFWFEVNGEIVDLREKFEAEWVAQADLTMLAVMIEATGGAQ